MSFLLEKGVVLVRKPKGVTSFDVVYKIRKRLGVKKVGHAGTLDPMAEGLLIVGVGPGTKKLSEYLKLPKTYQAEILLGKQTNTGDITGKVISEKDVQSIEEEALLKTLSELKGTFKLSVPAFSAIKVGGQKLYKRARRGEVFVPPTREMTITEIKLLGIKKETTGFTVTLLIGVSSGTYIRSIAEELGRRLGLPATLSELVRKTIGRYSLEDAVEVEVLPPTV